MRKTYYLEQDGIRVDGCKTKTDARKQWESARDSFAKTSAECGQWVFQHRSHVLIVAPLPHDTWQYTIVRPDTDRGVVNATCMYGAKSHVAAIVSALGALVQSLWSADQNDSELFDGTIKAARIFPAEAAQQRSDFLYLTSRWRESSAA